MRSTDDHRRIRFWRPESLSVTGMLRVEREDRVRTTYSEHFLIAVVYEGAFDGWYRGDVRTHVAGALRLKEPGEIHRALRVHAPFTMQGACFSHEIVAAAAAALGLRGPARFKASGFGPEERAARLAFAMHAALVRPEVPAIERDTLVAETLGELLGESSRSGAAPEAVLELCAARGIAFLPFFPLAVGNVGTQKPALAAIAERHGASPSQIALAWLLARSPVILPIPGTSSVAHLEEHWEARRIALSPEEMEAIGA